jgi:hypothetical protein
MEINYEVTLRRRQWNTVAINIVHVLFNDHYATAYSQVRALYSDLKVDQ